MAFSIICTNKGCGDHMEPYIDKDTDKVYCSSCDNELFHVTHFAKIQMKSMKQFKQKKTISFAIKCKFCGKEDRPVIVLDKIVCPSCKTEHSHLSEAFKYMLKGNLKKVSQDV